LNPAISQGVEAVILRSIEKDPALRYQSAADLARDLRTVRAGGHVPSHNPATAADEPAVINSRDDTTVVLYFGSRARAAKVVLLVALAMVLAWTGSRAARLLMAVPEPLQVAVAVPAVPVAPSVPDPAPTPPPAPEENLEAKMTVAAEVTRPVKEAAPKTVPRRPVDSPPVTNTANNAPVVAAPPPPPPPPVEASQPVAEPLPEPPLEDDVLPGRTVAPVGAPARQRELSQFANSVRLLVTSPSVPEPFTVIVTMDSEVLLRHDVQGPVSEEVSLPPGQHRLRVNLLMAARRIGRPQEVTGRFFPGQRRVLNIEFLPDAPRGSDKGERNRFTVTLK